MSETHLRALAKEIVQQTGFVLGKIIYQGEYYSPDKIRNIIFDGFYRDKPAVLKIYDDPRLMDEGPALDGFNKKNKSKILIAPQLYAHQTISSKKGWLIMEKLPDNGHFFNQPLSKEKREDFLKLYLEYRDNFPNKPHRFLTLAENLPADEFHIFRIERWFQLANDKEAELTMSGESSILKSEDFIPRFKKGLALIRQEFSKREMVWSHGHFKPHDIFEVPDKKIYYLTDFAHSRMYPQGYELGFIIWADWLMSADWQLDYSVWKQGTDEWMNEIKKIAPQLNLENFSALMRASLVERSLGAILADICAAERPKEEKEVRISLLYEFLDELLS